MSNEIFGMAEDHMGNMTGPLSYRGLPLASGYHSNSTASPETTTPSSSTSPSHLGDLDGNSSPDDYMLSEVRMNLHQTCFTPHVNDRVNAWNQSISLMGSAEMTSLEGNNLNTNSGDGGDDPRALTSPQSTSGPSPLGSREASRRCSSENNCCSLGSGELMMRSNSFNLEDEVLPVFTSMEESFMSPLSLLQDNCAGLQDNQSMEGFTVEKTTPAKFDAMGWLLAEHEKLNAANHVNLPIEMESLSDSVNSDADQVGPPSAEAGAEVGGQPSNLNATFFALQQMNGTTLVDPTPEGHDSAAKTSTPLLHSGNLFSLLSFSGSSFSGSTDSPALCPPQGLHIPTTLKPQRVARLSTTSGKAVKTDIRTFPKPDYSSVKSRITTRLSHQSATPAKAMQAKSSKMNGCAKPSQVNEKALNKVATAKLLHTAAAVSQTTTPTEMQKTFIQSDGEDASAANPSQRGPLSISEDAEGVSRGSPRSSLGTGNEDATSALSAELSPCPVQAAAAASGQGVTSLPTMRPPFNVTFCSSLPLETLDKNDEPKPSTEVSHRNGVGSGAASCGDTPPLAVMRPVDSLTSQHGPSRVKRRTSSSSVFNLSGAAQTSGPPRSGNLSNKRDNKAGVEMGAPEGSGREFRKISLVVSRHC